MQRLGSSNPSLRSAVIIIRPEAAIFTDRECSDADSDDMENLVGSSNLILRVICQNGSADDLVETSTSHDKLFSSIDEKTKHGNAKLLETRRVVVNFENSFS